MANTMTLTSQPDPLKPKIENPAQKMRNTIKVEEFDDAQSRDSEDVCSKAGNSSSRDEEWDEFSHGALEIAPITPEGLLNPSLDV